MRDGARERLPFLGIIAALVVCGIALTWTFLDLPGRTAVIVVAILIEALLAAALVAVLVSAPRAIEPGRAALVRCPQCSNTFPPPVGAKRITCPVCAYEAEDRLPEVGDA